MNAPKLVVVFGATGLIGRELVSLLNNQRYEVIIVTRNKSKAKSIFGVSCRIEEIKDYSNLKSIINGAYAVINLAGENIATIWTKNRKKKILTSRISTSKSIAIAINTCKNPPAVLIQASAVGYYHYNSHVELNELGQKGSGFLSDVVEKWEQAVADIKPKTRIVYLRTGVVLSAKGGFLGQVLMPTKLYLGSWFGNGEQVMPWIHINDHISAILFLLRSNDSNGVYNLVSPNPVSQKILLKTLGRILSRPVFIKIPPLILRPILGKMVDEVLIANQKVKPERLVTAGFTFTYADIRQALIDLFAFKKP